MTLGEKEKTPYFFGVKKTKQRGYVMEALNKASAPLSAMDILMRLRGNGESNISVSTVYRTLEMLCKKGAVLKTSDFDNKKAVYELIKSGHPHYAVCMGCKKKIAIENCPMDDFKPKFADSGFKVLAHKVEMYGLCKNCSKRK